MSQIVIMVLSGIATIFVLLAAIGIVRMPDFYLRLSVTVKATTLGIGIMLAAAAIFFADTATTSKALAIIFFLVLTAPVAAQMIGRTAYFIGTPLWKNSVVDELKNMYDMKSHALKSGPEAEGEMREEEGGTRDKEGGTRDEGRGKKEPGTGKGQANNQ
jgi:multicomponent Na+:H+ antiporter subunit G